MDFSSHNGSLMLFINDWLNLDICDILCYYDVLVAGFWF